MNHLFSKLVNICVIITITYILPINSVLSQNVLKKKQVHEKLVEIYSMIEKNNFENAIEIYFSEYEIILKENVSKKDMDKYCLIDSILQEKRQLFDYNKKLFESYQNYYYSNEFCNSTGLLQLELTSQNCDYKTYEAYNNLKPKVAIANEKCFENSVLLQNWKKSYNSSNFEEIFHILNLSYIDECYFSSEEKKELDSLQLKLKVYFDTYNTVKNSIIVNGNKIINSINYNTITFENCLKIISELNEIQNNYQNELKKLAGNAPKLLSEVNTLNNKIDIELLKLVEVRDDLKPLSPKEVTQHVSNGGVISPDYIERKCVKITDNIFPIFDLDVFAYFDIRDYDTDLQKENFKKSADYLDKLSKLKELREEMLNSTYYFKREKLFIGTNYNVKKKGFDLTINVNFGYGTASAQPPKSIMANDNFMGKKFIQLLKLPTIQVEDSFFGNGIKSEIFFVSIDEKSGLEIELNRQDIVVYYLFKPERKQTVKYKYYNMVDNRSAGWYEITDDVIVSNFLRVIIANEKTSQIYFDRVY